MERRVINPSAKPGSIYNACVDQVISEPIGKPIVKQEVFEEKAICRIIKGDASEADDLLRWMGVEDDLHLSLLTMSTKREGIAAVLDYKYRIDQNTRILHYYWKRRTDISHSNNPRIPKTDDERLQNATHVITSVDYGIDLLIIFHLPPLTESIELIDQALASIRCSWCQSREIDRYAKNDEQVKVMGKVMEKVERIYVFSNLKGLVGEMTIDKISQHVKQARDKSAVNRPIKCRLEQIKESKTTSVKDIGLSNPSRRRVFDKCRQFIVPLRTSLRNVEVSFAETNQVRFSSNFHTNLVTPKTLLNDVKRKFIKQMKILGDAIRKTHLDPASSWNIDEILKSTDFTRLGKEIQELESFVRTRNSTKQKIFSTHKNHSDTVKNGESRNQIITAPNHLNFFVRPPTVDSRDTSGYQQLDHDQVSPRTTNCHADPLLSKANISTRVDQEKSRNVKDSTSHESVNDGSIEETESSGLFRADPHMPDDRFNTINILLLGESGVGKSTFINAFANYLTFDNLQQAQQSEPVVVMPVSFLLTTGPDFEEHMVTFGECDASNNEHFNDQGQSVTQHCRSYTFDLPSNSKQHMRIIDTPGFGDTRGIEQDHINIEHILQYISHLSHLDAICFLLKPNESRMNTSFRLCFHQLFSLLGRTAYPNLIFCFTNGRSTFYTLGNTAPTLQKMIADFDHDNSILFGKQNIFCFDNEAFRYLVARRNLIDFTDEEQKEYERSWTISVKESRRLTKYIDEKLTMFRMDDDTWQSVKHAQLQIMSLVRPILETMRNHLRNLLLQSTGQFNQCITMSASPVYSEASYCRDCFLTEAIGPFLVKIDIPHYISGQCTSCDCSSDVHRALKYCLEYRFITQSTGVSRSSLETSLDELCALSAAMGRFLSINHYSSNEDAFSNGWIQMIDEEIKMVERGKSKTLNKPMTKLLSRLLEKYESSVNDFQAREKNNGPKNLAEIYAKIKQVKNNPMVKEQMIALKKTEKQMLEETERSVHCI